MLLIDDPGGVLSEGEVQAGPGNLGASVDCVPSS